MSRHVAAQSAETEAFSKEGSFTRQPSEEAGELASDLPPQRQGARVTYGMKNEEAGCLMRGERGERGER